MKKNINRFIEIERIDPPKINEKERQTQFKEIYIQHNDLDIKHQADRCLECGNPYCQWKCPVHNYIPQWLKLAYEGRIIEAAELSHQTNSFPEICGRICPQDRLCEGSCTLEDGFGAVTIGNVEKYITDEAFKLGWKPNYTIEKRSDKKVAIIGAGPAGLACADMLNRSGINVTVFDRQSTIGGLMTFGVPAFKLEKNIIKNRFNLLKDAGIVFKLDTEIGKDIQFEQLLSDFDAVFIGVGTYQPLQEKSLTSSNINVIESLTFLSSVNKNILENQDVEFKPQIQNKKILVLGGGDTAMDCIRTSIRLNALSVTCAYRRNENDMPGSKREYINSLEEGCKFIFNAQPTGLTEKNGKVTGVKFIQTKVNIGSDGQKTIETINNSEFEIEADIVITAFGFRPEELPWLNPNHVNLDHHGRIKISYKHQQSSNSKIFAGGDIVRGASLVVYAIADGMEAAREIAEFLN